MIYSELGDAWPAMTRLTGGRKRLLLTKRKSPSTKESSEPKQQSSPQAQPKKRYASRGSRKGPSIVLGHDVPTDVMLDLRRAIHKAARQWGVVFVLLYPDGQIYFVKRWQDDWPQAYWVGTYTRNLTTAGLRADLYHQADSLLGYSRDGLSCNALYTVPDSQGIRRDDGA